MAGFAVDIYVAWRMHEKEENAPPQRGEAGLMCEGNDRRSGENSEE